jgi:surface protein
MKPKIIARDNQHLIKLINIEIALNGKECDLNHIDVSLVKSMRTVFSNGNFNSRFNGDISKWDVSNVTNMDSMFRSSKFNEDISNWNVSNVTNMYYMFVYSKFNKEISNWDVSSVIDMEEMFAESNFKQDLSKWKPISLEQSNNNIFIKCPAPIPYWANYDSNEKLIKAIESYCLSEDLSQELSENNSSKKKVKI